MKILVIEDEILIQKSIKKMLEIKGAQVDSCASGKEAIDLILNNDYQRIICDLMLQDISGFDVIEEAKRKYNLQQIVQIFVIMTAYSSDLVRDQASKYGCTILNKPFKNLNKAIETMLEFNNEEKL